MTHEEALRLVRAQFERGDLPDADRAAMRDHLRTCAACRRAYDVLAEAEQALDPEGADATAARRLWPEVEAEADAMPAPVSNDEPTPPTRRRWALVAAPAALAAAAALALLSTTPPSALPEYGLEMTPRPPQALRGADAGPPTGAPVLDDSGQLTMLLRPARAHPRALEARAYRVKDGRFEALDPEWQTSQEGAMRFALPAAAALPTPGDWRVVVVLAEAGHLPDLAAVQAALPPPGGALGGALEREGFSLWWRRIDRR